METSITQNRLMKLFTHPVFIIVGIIGSLASLISIPLAVYFYLVSKDYPELMFYVHPVKAVLVQSGQASKLTASYENKLIETDVTTVQVAIWNQGKQSIKSINVLQSIVIYTENKAPILEASVKKCSRDVIQPSLTTTEFPDGRVGVSWNILERDDGCVIQLIYAGKPDVNLKIAGVVEGQKQITQLSFAGNIPSPSEQYNKLRGQKKSSGVALLISGLLMLAFPLFTSYTLRQRRTKKLISISVEEVNLLLKNDEGKIREFRELEKSYENARGIPLLKKLLLTILFLMPIISIGMGIYYLFIVKEPNPPFGF